MNPYDELRQLLSDVKDYELDAARKRQEAFQLMVQRRLCKQGGDPQSNGRGFCCQDPFNCQGRQP